ncbi:hypothetical protein BRADI_2g43080v3 [Brachypodium distachyon]|uniref:Uncharacterized protein n=1 Tax=Brachypodium distachyon TaxID=15368 RepID=A0A0Q3GDW5_BRADI|nr:hypothetical protein BRADI_2g43080v3 [Brachypodium distachyon]
MPCGRCFFFQVSDWRLVLRHLLADGVSPLMNLESWRAVVRPLFLVLSAMGARIQASQVEEKTRR